MSKKHRFESMTLLQLKEELRSKKQLRDATEQSISTLENEVYWRMNPETPRPNY